MFSKHYMSGLMIQQDSKHFSENLSLLSFVFLKYKLYYRLRQLFPKKLLIILRISIEVLGTYVNALNNNLIRKCKNV